MSTSSDLAAYYASLLIIQYASLPKASATIEALVLPVFMPDSDGNSLPLEIQNGFNLAGDSPAIGKQLQMLAKYAGVKNTGIGVSGPITLDDADFLTLIKFATIVNSAGSSLNDIQNALQAVFPGGEVLVFDYANMYMSYFINSSIGSQDVIQLVVNEGYLPAPMGVQLATPIYSNVLDAFFGFRTYLNPGYNVSPMNDYGTYNLDWPWLSYDLGLANVTYMTDESGNSLTQEDGSFIFV